MNYETLFDSETIAGDEFEFDELESDGEAIDPEFEDEVRRRRRGATPRRRASKAVRRVSRQLSTGCSCKQTPPSEYVRWLQTALNEVLRQQLPVNGVISPATRNALRSFQQQQGLRVDGIAGPETKRALVSARAGGAQPAAEPEPPPAPESEFEFAFEDEFETSTTRKPIDLGEIVVCGGKPFAVLDNFTFNSASLRRDSTRNHAAQVAAIAAEIRARAARRKPVPSVCIVGHTDAAGSVAFNYGLGLQRARTVKDALCKALGTLAGSMTFVVNSMGETDPAHTGGSAAANAGNRRVDVHLLTERVKGEGCGPVPGGRKLPHDSTTCGFPLAVSRKEFEFSEEDEQEWEEETSTAVQPKLCLYQEASNSSHRNHFHHQALGTARRIGAIGSPDAANCKRKVGATPYNTGADIIAAIRAAWHCTGKKPIQAVHIFGHSGSSGVFGTTLGTAGLYQNVYSLDAASRAAGARTISDIPLDILSDNVIFVLHGCNQAEGCNVKGNDDNFAQSLLEHLAATLKNPKVYGHYNSGCAGRNNSWCLYAKTTPKGRAHSAPTYTDPGGCATPAKAKEFEFEFEWEDETGGKTANACQQIQHFRIHGYDRGAHALSTAQQQSIAAIKSAIRKRARTCGAISMVVIAGHASTEGDAARNKELSRRRAEAVKAALEPTFRGARVFVAPEGETKQLVRPDNSDAAQRQNRRVEIFLQ